MPHLNELQQKYESRGLSVIGVTSEGVGPTEKWVEANKVEYSFAYDKGGKLMRELGVTGIPDCILVNPSGKIVWQGNPYRLTDELIEEHLEGSLKTPVWEWPKDASAARKAIVQRKFKKAIDEAAKLSGQQTGVIGESLIALVESRAKALETAFQGGDFLAASESAKTIIKECAGLGAADLAKEIAKQISSNSEAKQVMKAQVAVRKLKQEKVKRPKDILEILKKLQKISKKHGGTAAGREADAYTARLEAKLRD